MLRARSFVPVVAAALLVLPVSSAHAVPCGDNDPATGEPARGTLVLDEDASVVERKFGRDSGAKSLSLIYTVTGCELEAVPAAEPLPLKDFDELPDGVLREPDSARARARELTLIYRFTTDEFDPGSYGALVEVSDPATVNTVRTQVTVSRSESKFWIPLLLGVIAGALGFVVFVVGRLFARHRLIVPVMWIVIGAIFACGAGAWAALANYLDQDVWVFEDNWKATALVAFTQSTAGVMVALLGKLFSEEPAPEPAPPTPRPQPAPPPGG